MTTRLKRLLARSPRAYRWARRANAWLLFARRRPHEPDFAGFALFEGRDGLLLDIGANTGQSALSFRIYKRRSPILSLEPQPGLEGDLRALKSVLRGFDYMICAAGEEKGSATLYVPAIHGMPLTGEASLSSDFAGDSYWAAEQGAGADAEIELTPVEVDVCRVDDLALSPDFVKIDVEGHELGALRGMTETIGRSRPVFLIERSAGEADVTEFLGALGYAPYSYEAVARRLEPFTGQPALNLFFVPDEEKL